MSATQPQLITAAKKKSAELQALVADAWHNAETSNQSQGLQTLFHRAVGITKALAKIEAQQKGAAR